MDVFNAGQKRYLATCLRMSSTHKVDNIDRKHMCNDDITKKVELRFAKECKRLLSLCDKIGTKGDKKHENRESEAHLNHKYYWGHKEEDILFNSMKDVYNILNNQDKVTMKHFYHIICDLDLDKGLCDMKRLPCTCTGCVEEQSKP